MPGARAWLRPPGGNRRLYGKGKGARLRSAAIGGAQRAGVDGEVAEPRGDIPARCLFLLLSSADCGDSLQLDMHRRNPLSHGLRGGSVVIEQALAAHSLKAAGGQSRVRLTRRRLSRPADVAWLLTEFDIKDAAKVSEKSPATIAIARPTTRLREAGKGVVVRRLKELDRISGLERS